MTDPPRPPYLLYVDDELPEVREDLPWAIRDLQTADWALKRLGRLKAEKEEIDGQYQKAISMLQARKDALLQRVQKGIDFFSANIVAFAELNKRQITDGKTRSRSLLHGRIGFRKQAGRVRVVDERAVIEWAKRQPLDLDLLRYTPAVNKDQLNEYVKREGVIPDGCEYEEERDLVSFSCDPIPDEWVLPDPRGVAHHDPATLRPGLPTPGQDLPVAGEGPGRDPASREGPGEPSLPAKVR